MNLKCLFQGHRMVNGQCSQCLKTECEIKGHVWVYSDIWTRTWVNGNKYSYPKERKCSRCEIIEKLIDRWTRIK